MIRRRRAGRCDEARVRRVAQVASGAASATAGGDGLRLEVRPELGVRLESAGGPGRAGSIT